MGIQALFTGVNYIAVNIYFFITQFFESSYSIFNRSSIYFLSAAVSLIVGLIIVKQSKPIAVYISDKANFTAEIKIITDTKELLCLFILFLALSSLLTNIPSFISDILDLFTASNKNILSSSYTQKKVNWVTSILEIALPCLIIVYARPLSNYFSKNLTFQSGFEIEENATPNFDFEEKSE